MPATPVKIGPFSGGLNSYSGPTSIGDNEVVDIQNFDIDFDGSLYSRAPITILDSNTEITYEGEIELLGWFIDTDNTRYLFAAFDRHNGTGTTRVRNEETGAWATANSAFAATAMVQYANKAYLLADPTSSDPCGSWTPTGGFTPIAGMPKGTSFCVYKERLFIGGSTTSPNRIFFSNAADFATYDTGVNFFDVRSGDGQNVVTVRTFQDTVVIFKNDSIYVYSYDSNPSRGSVRVINGAVGLTNKECVVEYESSLYIHHNDSLYQISNWNFTVVNLKVPFVNLIKYDIVKYGDTNYPTLSVMTDRLIIHHYDNIYVFNLRAGSWTKWDVDESRLFTKFITVPRLSPNMPERYYAGCRARSAAMTNRCVFEWRPLHSISRSEEMVVFVITKTYDFNVPYTFKRLFWWGVDMLAKSEIVFTVHPVVYSSGVTHAQLSAYKHEEILGSYLRPIGISLDVTTSRDIPNNTGERLFIKLLKSLRFRQIFFSLSGTTDGTTATGPLRVYSVVAFIDNKELVSKEIS